MFHDVRRHPGTMRLLLQESLSQRAQPHPLRSAIGWRPDVVDIKKQGVLPVVNIARWAALSVGSSALPTVDRLRDGRRAPRCCRTSRADILIEVFDVLQRLRLSYQLRQRQAGQSPTDRLARDQLTPIDARWSPRRCARSPPCSGGWTTSARTSRSTSGVRRDRDACLTSGSATTGSGRDEGVDMGSTDAFAGRPVVGQRMSAVDYVLRDLRDAVESGVIHVGERLPSEAALAARYSVSRTVIREVLRALEATGRTVTRDGKGTFVVATHPNEVLFEGYSAAHLMEAQAGHRDPRRGVGRAATDRRTTRTPSSSSSSGWNWSRTRPCGPGWTPRSTWRSPGRPATPCFADVVSSIAAALAGQSELLNMPAAPAHRIAGRASHHRGRRRARLGRRGRGRHALPPGTGAGGGERVAHRAVTAVPAAAGRPVAAVGVPPEVAT